MSKSIQFSVLPAADTTSNTPLFAYLNHLRRSQKLPRKSYSFIPFQSRAPFKITVIDVIETQKNFNFSNFK